MRRALRLTVGQRFAALVALCAVAILVPALAYTLHVWGDRRALLRERDGLAPTRTLLDAVRLVQQHRDLSAVWLGGQQDQASSRGPKADEAERAMASFAAQLNADEKAAGSELAKRWASTRQAWAALRAEVEQRQLDGAASSARHSALIGQMLIDLEVTLAHWGLVYDPDAADYHTIVGALQEAPLAIEIMGQMRAQGADLLGAPDKATPAARAAYAALADSLQGQFSRVRQQLDQATRTDAGHEAALGPAVKALSDFGEQGIAYARQHVVEPATLSHSSQVFLGDTTRFIDGMYDAVGKLADHLATSLAERTRTDLGVLVVMMAAALVLFSVALGVAVHTGLWLRRQLGTEPDALREAAMHVARGDLAHQVPVRPGDETSVVAAMRQMQQALAQLVGEVRANATQVATASSQIAQGNQDLSSRTESQASALQQTAASMEQLRTTIGLSADSARQASELASQASDVASRGGTSVDELAQSMRRIEESSRRIAEIIGTIDGLAFQTNILALNAAVEAARAGEQGRGFAVVASEVRALAQRSAEAAREIRHLITDSVERVELGMRQGGEAAATMREVVQSIGRVSDLIGEVSSAAQEQNAGVGQVSTAVAQMDEATQRNAALVEESAAAAEALRDQAQALQHSVANFRTEMA